MTETFYDVLGVEPDATASDIEDAYRERLKETHPDHNDDADADEATQRVIEARNVLTDDDERARYDRLGHDAYVGADAAGSDHHDARGAAARAAREAGWADSETDGPSESTAAGTNAGPSERRRRERTASERVRETRTAASSGATGATATGQTTAGTSPDSGASTGRTRPTGTSTRDSRQRDRIYGAGTDSGEVAYNVRHDVSSSGHSLRAFVADTPLSLAALTFVLYPIMVASTMFPDFPLVVNATVGLCALLLIGYLQSQPSVGVLVFGTWSVLVPLALVAFGVPVTGLVGLAALGSVWLPFGFSLLTRSVVGP
ncbi:MULTISPECIES: J domain-containing protein [Halomicrobium]|uniref:Heat shock protein DnaJ domain protein n=2 Tax=Halomicrobium mukohataei TaxID=57705 RepID=C7NYV3_HALMD|nr:MULTISPECIES: DnaJ domain-containing protein [Halomicrobium]ACV48642.1 heat shock protein DnaJ domain protein [Halomicrobium mukohataei DSM 12286]QCD67041.1 molecular chaperone DnaJ [Halomicrobium mukohataei]QFR21851.1 DnaJ domain-containing protein [Halomicrobium sp. ZPS1]